MNLKVLSYAKINLALKVGPLLPNGLHEIRSIIQTVDLADQIIFEKIESGIIVEATGDCPDGEDNLVHKAILRLRNIRSFGGIKATILKNIPSGSGLGGASSNAAAALKAINELYGLKINDDALLDLSRGLGSDVPALYVGGCTYVEGTGDIVRRIDPPLKNAPIVIVKPQFSISTKEAYKGIDNYPTRLRSDLDPADFHAAKCFNDFEPWALKVHKELTVIKDLAMAFQPIAACLTGSGSAYFAVYDNDDRAEEFRTSVIARDCVSTAYIVRSIDRGVDY